MTGGSPGGILWAGMLAEARIGANVPVSNLDEAMAFWGGKLGLSLFERGNEHRYARFSGAG